MKRKMYPIAPALAFVLAGIFPAKTGFTQANTSLSNLSATAVNADLLPGATNIRSIGSVSKAWKDLYLNNLLYLGGSRYLTFTSSLGLQNTGLGSFSLAGNTSGYNNTGLGAYTLRSNTSGFNNVAIGYNSLFKSAAGHNNVAVGVASLYNNTSGVSNSAMGNSALTSNTTGNNNMAIGANALGSNTSGTANIGIGNRAMFGNKTNSYQVAIGDSALFSNEGGLARNTALGSKSMYATTTGAENTAVGFQTLKINTTGSNNTATGYLALSANISGSNNTAVGFEALFTNNSSYNTATGYLSLGNNSAGTFNAAYGASALNASNSDQNSAFGYSALVNNSSGGANTGVGLFVMQGNTTGSTNTAIGAYALRQNLSGNTNTGLGAYTTTAVGNLTGSTMVGYFATATASNQVTIGGTTVTAVRGAAPYVQYSDGRYKNDVQADVPGLAFIKSLRPVTYHYNIHGINDKIHPVAAAETRAGLPVPSNSEPPIDEAAITAKEKKLYSGFIAQEVEASAKKLNYDFSGVYTPQNDNDLYGLSYSDFVAPLVKAVQQLSDSNASKNAQIDSLNAKVASLEFRFGELAALVRGAGSGNVSLHNATLEQIVPNPNRNRATISYALPQNYGRAKIMIMDMNGRVLRTVPVSGSGRGSLVIDTSNLSAGVYNTSFYIDGALAGTRQMVVAR